MSRCFGETLTTSHSKSSILIDRKGVDDLSVRKLESMENIAVLIRGLSTCIAFVTEIITHRSKHSGEVWSVERKSGEGEVIISNERIYITCKTRMTSLLSLLWLRLPF